jgi:hypothetical protein
MSSELKLTGASGGNIILQGNDTITTDQVFTFPDAAGTFDSLERAGNVLQVVTASTSVEVTNSTATMTDTGLSVSITPSSATNKILVFVSQPYRTKRDQSSAYGSIILLRDSTQLTGNPKNTGGGFLLGYASTGITTADIRGVYSATYLDSPTTTSQVTYKTQMAVNSATDSSVIETQENGTIDGATSYITVMEVAG